jgi:hypothetical protein
MTRLRPILLTSFALSGMLGVIALAGRSTEQTTVSVAPAEATVGQIGTSHNSGSGAKG